MPRKEIARFTVENLSILDENGRVDHDLEPDLAEEDLLSLYRAMVMGREADQRMLKLQRQGRLGTFSPSTGQEAGSVGPTFAMSKMDWFVGAFRELGGRLMRGHRFADVLRFWNGMEEGSAIPAELRTFYDSVIVGAQIPHATGLAYAQKLKNEDAATVCWFGDGATSEGDFHEGLNFAAVWQAPVVFICQNNGWAISIPRAKQTRSETIAQKAVAYGIPGIQVDGNDVLATYAAAKEALDRAKSGGGPTLIEAVTYRMGVHTTADDPTRYRDDSLTDQWQAKDPLNRFRIYLEAKGYWDEAREAALWDTVKAEIAAEVHDYENGPELKIDTPFDHVFGTRHPVIEEQRAEFLALLAEEGDRG